MSRIPTLDINVGETAEVADINTVLTAWNNVEIGAENLRDEGLDRRSLADGIVHPTDADAHDLFQTSNEQLGLNATSPTLIVISSAEAVAANLALDQTEGEELLVFAGCRYKCSHGGTGNNPILNFQLGYATDYTGTGTGTWTMIGDTARDPSIEDGGVENRGRVSIAHHFQTDGPDLTFGLFAWLTGYTSGQTYDLSNATVFTRRLDL